MSVMEPPWAELGVLAERAAMAVGERETELVDGRLAAALATVVAGPDVRAAGAEVLRLAAAARDVGRPLHRRVAVVAALHQALRRVPDSRVTDSVIHHCGSEDS